MHRRHFLSALATATMTLITAAPLVHAEAGPPPPNPQIVIDSLGAQPGASVEVYGTGFGYDQQVTITVGGALAETVDAPFGYFDAEVDVPEDATPGPGTITAVDGANNSAHTAFDVAEPPSVTPERSAAQSTVNASGGSFNPGDSITFALQAPTAGSAPSILGSTTAASDGSINATFAVPKVPPGRYNLIVVDDSSGSTFPYSFQVNAPGTPGLRQPRLSLAPSIFVIPRAARIGGILRVRGLGFANDDTVTLTLDGKTVADGKTSMGRFVVALTLPQGTPSGVNTLVATDSAGLTASSSIDVISSVRVTPRSAVPGANFVVSGGSFRPGDSVSLELASVAANSISTVLGTTTAGTDGTVNDTVTVPAGEPRGQYQLIIIDNSSGTSLTTPFIVR